ncbi:ATP-dependent nuclease [Herbaspirillum aquaticum]|uniref:ATP-dependent endonuclease n=1 Tax=Herbaspirillum aquaticum TaxID=568783 RepID=A0A225SLQ3_9BURK|nr:AAA family ATPase [Herbaspirillum aquaticum]OWY31875.1 ATP-dependent endonuclease [Herbaspirillum aquaticum]
MRVARVDIKNFRGIQNATLLLPKHGVFIGDNNTGKTTVLEALDLTLGPDRLNRFPPIDEHDFFQGKYLPIPATEAVQDLPPNETQTEITPTIKDEIPAPKIEIEVAVVDLNNEQKARFWNYIEFWDSSADNFHAEKNLAGVDEQHIIEALRITFHGWYDIEEDDFQGKTYFTRSLLEEEKPTQFTKKDKQLCGFLYLRSVRTGSRALSLEHGSLLDIILRLKEVRPQMWEDTIRTLSPTNVAEKPDLGLSPVLESINTALKKYVPREWGIEPHLKISNLTREHLRKIITAFIATGTGSHAAPFYRQGTGTINMLVLALLSQIAEGKQNVIFAMEEPETAIPPYAQKRIVHEVRNLAAQAIFTSHSPYVLEEFSLDETVVLSRDHNGSLKQQAINLPDNVKLKRYRQEFRTRFCEGLLARRILIAEGSTESSTFPTAFRRLAELNPAKYSSLEALGICTLDAGSETNIPGMAKLYREVGKRTFAFCDKQDAKNKALIEEQVELLFMHNEKGIENLVINGTTEEALKRFADLLDWPQHLAQKYPVPKQSVVAAIKDYFLWAKGNWGISDFIAQCGEQEIPLWIREAA